MKRGERRTKEIKKSKFKKIKTNKPVVEGGRIGRQEEESGRKSKRRKDNRGRGENPATQNPILLNPKPNRRESARCCLGLTRAIYRLAGLV